jgi:STAS domain
VSFGTVAPCLSRDGRSSHPLLLTWHSVTGMDTSTVSIVSDILNLCQRHDCKLFLSGMSPELRSVLAHAGVKPLGGERSDRKLRFFTTLDAAIGKAEDLLLEGHFQERPPSLRKLLSLGEESGFHFALARVDEQVGSVPIMEIVHRLARSCAAIHPC